jgi:hypothetical protein
MPNTTHQVNLTNFYIFLRFSSYNITKNLALNFSICAGHIELTRESIWHESLTPTPILGLIFSHKFTVPSFFIVEISMFSSTSALSTPVFSEI